MKELRFRLVAVLVLVLLVATIHVLLSVPKGVQAATPNSPAASPDPSFPSSLYARAAQALRQNNLQTSRQLLAEVAETNPAEAATTRLIEGLYAYESGDETLAEELLAAASTPGGLLEDWRLFLLAESARENGNDETAAAALAQLLAGSPSSPLRPEAYLEAAKLAWDAGDERRTLALIDGARREGLSGEVAVELEHLAWKIGREINDDEVRREAGRRLLSRPRSRLAPSASPTPSAPWTATSTGTASSQRRREAARPLLPERGADDGRPGHARPRDRGRARRRVASPPRPGAHRVRPAAGGAQHPRRRRAGSRSRGSADWSGSAPWPSPSSPTSPRRSRSAGPPCRPRTATSPA